MDQTTLDRISQELIGDKEVYLENCKNNYAEYLTAAQILFPDYYRSLNRSDSLLPIVQESIAAKENGEADLELSLLEKLIDLGIDIPYVYTRLAIIYSKVKEYNKAQAVCQKWFNSIYWKVPNMSTSSLELYRRWQKLNSKLGS
jgi:hypothetical protein